MIKNINGLSHRRLLYTSVTSIMVLGVILTILITNVQGPSKRDLYEQFLNDEYSKLPDLQTKESKGEIKPQGPGMAAIQNYFMTIDPELKRVPLERLLPAFNEMKRLQENSNKRSRGTMQWNEIPSNMAGRTRAIMFDPNDSTNKKVWAGSVTGGLWYNNDITSNDSSWSTVNDFWDNLAISSITADPNDPKVFYVGTGESQTAVTIYRESSGRGIGIWKTIDGGISWQLLTSTSGFAYITDIKVRDENGSSVVYAGVVSGLYKGISHPSDPSDGLYRSIDGGSSWTQVMPPISGTSDPYAPADIEIGADGKIYIGTTNNLTGDGGSVILFSDLGTSGSWTAFDGYVSVIKNNSSYGYTGRVILATAPSDANIVYAFFTAGYLNTTNNFIYYEVPYVLSSNNKGASWTLKSAPDGGQYYWATIPWHALSAAVDPDDPLTIFAGGLNLFKSTNGGNSWTQFTDWFNYDNNSNNLPYGHADQHSITFRPGSSSDIVFSNDAGVFYTSNGTNSLPLVVKKTKSLNTLQFYTCAIHPDSGTLYYMGGLQDNGTHRYTGIAMDVTQKISGGDGAFCFIDEDEPNIQLTSVQYNRYYISDDNLTTAISFNKHNVGTFINPADYDNKLNILYTNATTFTGNYGDEILRVPGIPSNPYGEYVWLKTGSTVPFSNLKVSPHSAPGTTTLFIGSQSGRLFKVVNAQSNAQATEIGSNKFPTANISSIAIGGSNDTILLCFSNYGVSSIWQTHDGGVSWEEKEGNLPDMPVRWAIYHPQNSNQAMIATELGIWTANNLRRDTVIWLPSNTGLANVRIDMLEIRKSDNTVLAATHGRGLFTTKYELDFIESPIIDFMAYNDSILKGDVIDFDDLSTSGSIGWQWTFEGGSPSTSTQQNPTNIKYDIVGTFDVTLTVTYPTGSYSKTKTDYINVAQSTSDKPVFSKNDLMIYPNPTSGIVFIRQKQISSKICQISIFNMSGKQIHFVEKLMNETIQFDFADYKKGTYFIEINIDNNRIIRKLLIK